MNIPQGDMDWGLPNYHRKEFTYAAYFTITVTPDDVWEYGSEEEALEAKQSEVDSAIDHGDDGVLGGSLGVDFRDLRSVYEEEA